MEKCWNGSVNIQFLPFLLLGQKLTLETTVIVLIAAEILVAAINIIVDLYAGVD